MENVKTLQSSKVILVPSWNYISHWMGGNKKFVNPLTPLSDQDRISPYYICTISCTQVMKINKTINYGISNRCNLQTNMMRIWQTVRRITNDRLGIKGLNTSGPGCSKLRLALIHD